MTTRTQPGENRPAGSQPRINGERSTGSRTEPAVGPDKSHPAAPQPRIDSKQPTDSHTKPQADSVESPPAPPRPRRETRAPQAPPTAHPLRTESRRGFAPWAGAALLVALVWGLVATAEQWQGSWGETTDKLSIAAGLIGAPFALAAGAWHGGRERRLRMTELRASTARSPLAQLLTAALPLAAWLTAAYAATVAGALLACAPYASAGGPPGTVFAGAALSIAACSVLGQAVGRMLPWRLTAPALAICGYVLYGTLGNAYSDLRYLAFAHVRLFGDDHWPVWWYPILSALWVTGLAATAVLAHAAYRRATALLPLAAALTAAVVLLQSGDGMVRDNPLAQRQVCDGSTTPRVCVNATYPGLLPEVTRALSGLTGRLEGVRNLPVRFEDLGRRPREDEAQLPTLTPFGWSAVRGKVTDPEQYAWEAAHMLIRDECEEPPSAPRIRIADEAVLRWLAPDSVAERIRDDSLTQARQRNDTEELARYKAEDTAYEHLTAMTADERRAWLGRYFATAHECDPNPSEVPSL